MPQMALELCPHSATCEDCVVHTNNIVVSLKMPFFLPLAFSLNLNNISPTCKNQKSVKVVNLLKH